MYNQEEVREIKYIDKIICLDNGDILIGRILTDGLNETNFIHVYKPMIIQDDMEGNVIMRVWIPESRDDVFSIPIMKVVNISNPHEAFSKEFSKILMRTEDKTEELNDEEVEIELDEDVVLH
jgi:hypothetical protein